MDRFSGSEYTKMRKPLVIRGMSFPCYVNDFGEFYAEINEDDWLNAPTLQQLRTNLEKVVQERSRQISIPFTLLTVRSGVRKGVVRGIHASMGHFLVTWEDGVKDTQSRLNDFWEVPTEAQTLRLAELVKETDKLICEAKEIIATIPKISGQDMTERVKKSLKGDDE